MKTQFIFDQRAVLAANLSFYEAFASGDLGAMDAIWSLDHPCTCVHPGWEVLHGREEVMASWRAILNAPNPPDVRCSDAHAVIIEQAAYVTCTELINGARLAATNVYALEDGLWRIVHHHASPYAVRQPPSAPRPPRDALN